MNHGQRATATRGAYGIAVMFLIAATNVVICRELFTVEFTSRIESVEGSYMAISRWLVENWSNRPWFPLWYTGQPFHSVYQPLFPTAVAWLARVTGWTIQRSYHFFVAIVFCGAPVALYALAKYAYESRVAGLLSAAVYSWTSPINMVVPGIRLDAGHTFTGRRFQVLTTYGEGPHLSAAMLIPLVLIIAHAALIKRKTWATVALPLALAAVVLTSWPGTVGLSLALISFLIAFRSSLTLGRLAVFFGLSVVGYGLICPLVPPSAVAFVTNNAQLSDSSMSAGRRILSVALGLAVLVAFDYLLRRRLKSPWSRFFVNYSVLTGLIAAGSHLFGWHLLPQSGRFEVEFELAVSPLLGLLCFWLIKASPPRWRLVVAGSLALLFVSQMVVLRRQARATLRPLNLSDTIEFRMARWFDQNARGARVFAPGNVSLWMNMFTNTPQIAGCCENGVPSVEHRIATYTIYTGQNAGADDTKISILWLKAYGAHFVGVTGPLSNEFFHPFWNPKKFDGVLSKVWSSGDNYVYAVDGDPTSFAHVIPKDALVVRPPIHGLDVKDLSTFVDALGHSVSEPATFAWDSNSSASISRGAPAGEVLHLQVSYDEHWSASDSMGDLKVGRDALGMMYVEPGKGGRLPVHLAWRASDEDRYSAMIQRATLIAFIALAVGLGSRGWRRRRDLR